MTLKESIKDWCDPDVAAGWLAVSMGLMPEEEVMGKAKWVFWCNNPIGDSLYALVYDFVKVGVLEENDDGGIRWSPNFKGTWEQQTPS